LETKVTGILHEIGVPAHIRGYHYMREAILMAVDDLDVLTQRKAHQLRVYRAYCRQTKAGVEGELVQASYIAAAVTGTTPAAI